MSNLADLWLIIGIAFLLWYSWRAPPPEQTHAAAAPADKACSEKAPTDAQKADSPDRS